MPLKNTPTRYGVVTKFFHWAVFVLFVAQFVSANVMTRIGREQTVLGMNQDFLYNWHKSLGLIVLFLALGRLVWRRTTLLPDWAVSLSADERSIAARLEHWLYVLMFVVPITGYLFVMAGDYGVRLFGVHDLPNPIGKVAALATSSQFAHVVLTYVAVVVIAWHVGFGLKKQLYDGARYLQRMLPFGRH